jgi:hypothetical protein
VTYTIVMFHFIWNVLYASRYHPFQRASGKVTHYEVLLHTVQGPQMSTLHTTTIAFGHVNLKNALPNPKCFYTPHPTVLLKVKPPAHHKVASIVPVYRTRSHLLGESNLHGNRRKDVKSHKGFYFPEKPGRINCKENIPNTSV